MTADELKAWTGRSESLAGRFYEPCILIVRVRENSPGIGCDGGRS